MASMMLPASKRDRCVDTASCQLGCQDAAGGLFRQPLHSSRRAREPSASQDLIGYVGFAASISTAPTAAVGRQASVGRAISPPDS
jgi:hypothetical protein